MATNVNHKSWSTWQAFQSWRLKAKLQMTCSLRWSVTGVTVSHTALVVTVSLLFFLFLCLLCCSSNENAHKDRLCGCCPRTIRYSCCKDTNNCTASLCVSFHTSVHLPLQTPVTFEEPKNKDIWPPPSMLCFFVIWLHKNYFTNFHETLRRSQTWTNEEPINIWGRHMDFLNFL